MQNINNWRSWIWENKHLTSHQPDVLKLSSRHWNTGFVSSRVSHTKWGESASLALVGHASSDSVTIKIPDRINVLLHQPALHPIFPIGLIKTESDFIVRSVETDFERWTQVVAVISVDAYPFLAFPQEEVVSGCTVPSDGKETELGSSNQEAFSSAGKNTGVDLVPKSVSLWLFP